jgi:hypothetical protein
VAAFDGINRLGIFEDQRIEDSADGAGLPLE